jgi:hypothetical protein
LPAESLEREHHRVPRSSSISVRAERIEDSRLIEEICGASSSTLPASGVQCGVASAVGVDAITEGYDEVLEVVAYLERFIADHSGPYSDPECSRPWSGRHTTLDLHR